MKKMFLMHALPGSGKSTLAKQLCKDNSPCVILSTDNVQSDENGVYLYSSDYFGLAHKINIAKANEACKRGLNIVVDNTNLVAKDCKPYFDLATEYGYEFQLVEPTTAWANDIDECFKRNTHNVPREVLERMKKKRQSVDRIMDQLRRNEIVKINEDETYQFVPGLPDCIIVDMDGTVCTVGDRTFYDASNCDIVDTINPAVRDTVNLYYYSLKDGGYKNGQVIILSGREDKDLEPTKRFLKKHGVNYDQIFMRKKGDSRRDSIIKREIFDREIRHKYNPLCVFDDRLQVIRECWNVLGVWVFNCNQTMKEF